MTDALNRNTEAQLSRLERSREPVTIADKIADTDIRDKLYIAAACLINGKKLI